MPEIAGQIVAPRFIAVNSGRHDFRCTAASLALHGGIALLLALCGMRETWNRLSSPRGSLVWVAPREAVARAALPRVVRIAAPSRRLAAPRLAMPPLAAAAIVTAAPEIEAPPEFRLAPPPPAPVAVSAPTVPDPPLVAPVVHTGGFDHPPPAHAVPGPQRAAVTAAGFDSHTAGAPRAASAGLVRGTGFDTIRASSPEVAAARGVARAGFDVPAAPPGLPRAAPQPAPLRAAERRPVQILDKPKPRYTDDARRRRVEGAVRVEVLFTAAGVVVVRRVVEGLGFGLDEAACDAARQIRFRPATEEGLAVDQVAVLHIVFRITE